MSEPEYGIPRFLDSTWAMYGGKPSDPAEQIRRGIKYIRDRYASNPDFWRDHWHYRPEDPE